MPTPTQLVCRHGLVPTNCSICQPSTLSIPHTQSGLRANLETLLEEARPRLWRLARLNGVAEDVAEDVVQETSVEAWRHLEQLREPERFASWLDGICRNVCRRQARAQASTPREQTMLDNAGPEMFDMADPLAIDPGEELERQDMQTLLDRALGYLSTSSRELIELCYLAELPQREVALRLDISLGALELKLHRARKQLRQVLNGDLREDAATFGLLRNEDEAMGWQETRQWCWICARQRMHGKLERHPAGHIRLRLRCPDCSPRYDTDITNTGDWSVPGLEHLRSLRPAIKRAISTGSNCYRLMFDEKGCPLCRAPIQFQVIDQAMPNPLLSSYNFLPERFYIRINCPCCGEILSDVISVLLANPIVRDFILSRTCVLFEPNTLATCAGQDAIRTHLVDLTTSEELTIMAHPENLHVLATFMD